jgi:protein tyrosine/serine phosphatase
MSREFFRHGLHGFTRIKSVKIHGIRVSSVWAALAALTAFSMSVAARDTNWAVRVEQAGLPNLHRVSTNLYRCAQPTAAGLKAAEKLGIKTVISLRAFHTDKDEVESTNLRTERIRFNTWHPEDEDVIRFLKLVSNTNNGPYLLHCLHGADRTGTMIAIHRIAFEGWTKQEAIKEMTDGGFGYHTIWKNLIKYLNELDVDKLKKQAGIEKIKSQTPNSK